MPAFISTHTSARLSGSLCLGLWLAGRQAHRKHRAFAWLARHGHVTAHHARELAGDGKAEPRAAEALRGQGTTSMGADQCLVRAGWRITNGIKRTFPEQVRWTRLFAPSAAPNIRRAVSRRGSASFAKKSGNTFRHADKLGQRWRRWRLDISTRTASTSLE